MSCLECVRVRVIRLGRVVEHVLKGVSRDLVDDELVDGFFGVLDVDVGVLGVDVGVHDVLAFYLCELLFVHSR